MFLWLLGRPTIQAPLSLPSLRLRRKEWPRLWTPNRDVTAAMVPSWSNTFVQLSESLSTPSTRRTFTNVPRTQNATWVSVWWSVHPQWRVCFIVSLIRVYSSITLLSLLVLRRVLVCRCNQCVFVIHLIALKCRLFCCCVQLSKITFFFICLAHV